MQLNTMAGVAVRAAMQTGDRVRALAALQHIQDRRERQKMLREFGFLSELAQVHTLLVHGACLPACRVLHDRTAAPHLFGSEHSHTTLHTCHCFAMRTAMSGTALHLHMLAPMA